MPKTYKKRARKPEEVGIDISIVEYFNTGERPVKGTPADRLSKSRFFDGGKELQQTWKRHKKTILNKWNREKRDGLPWGSRFNET